MMVLRYSAALVLLIGTLLLWTRRRLRPATAFTILAMAGIGYSVFRSSLFLQFVLSLLFVSIGKLAVVCLTRKSDVPEYRVRDFLHTGIPPLLVGSLAELSQSLSHYDIVATSILAVVVSDSVSSDIGKAVGGRTRLITTLKVVAPGTDGGVSVFGTSVGVVAAMLFAALASCLSGECGGPVFALVTVFGIGGNAIDSLLGATVQRFGILDNEQVNLASEFAVALVGAIILS